MDFLNEIHNRHPETAIFAQAHLGHAPKHTVAPPLASTPLTAQVESAIEMFDALREAYSEARIVVMGHSIGAWISLEVSHCVCRRSVTDSFARNYRV